MDEKQRQKIISELKDFYKKLKSYNRYVCSEEQLSQVQIQYRDSLREKLVRQSGALKGKIIELTGHQYAEGPLTGRFDIWAEAFNTTAMSADRTALVFCIDAINEAIGKLESDIELGIRDKQGKVITKPSSIPTEPPKAFISHGKESAALRKLKEFIETLGIEPLIVKKAASLDKDVPDKVNLYLTQADFVIILATGDDVFEGKRHPRQNVIHEIGLAQKTRPGRIIYLLEEGTEFPSNIRPKVWESFKQRNMMDAFLGIIRELRAYGILKVIKFPIEEKI